MKFWTIDENVNQRIEHEIGRVSLSQCYW